MISASIAETHRFGRVRKNGYDPAEVDAVVARLADALRQSDERINALTEKLDAADISANAIRNTLVVAETSRDNIIAEARAEAEAMTAAARAEVAELAATAEALQTEVARSRDSILHGLYEEAERQMLQLERQTAERSIDAAWAVQEAIEVRNRTITDIEAEAAIKERTATVRADALMERVGSMEEAARKLEEAAASLADSVKQGTKVINLAALEELDEHDGMTAAIEDLDDTPNDTIVVVEDEPHLSVALPVADEVGEEDGDDDSPKTRYQRSTGVPLKERIKIARMSG